MIEIKSRYDESRVLYRAEVAETIKEAATAAVAAGEAYERLAVALAELHGDLAECPRCRALVPDELTVAVLDEPDGRADRLCPTCAADVVLCPEELMAAWRRMARPVREVRDDEPTRPYHLLSSDEQSVWDPENGVYLTAHAAEQRARRAADARKEVRS